MTLDRERAREVLNEELGSILLPEEVGPILLDRLEECVLPDETWDWWMARRIKAAEAKLATIRALCDESTAEGYVRVGVLVGDLRAVLDGSEP